MDSGRAISSTRGPAQIWLDTTSRERARAATRSNIVTDPLVVRAAHKRCLQHRVLNLSCLRHVLQQSKSGREERVGQSGSRSHAEDQDGFALWRSHGLTGDWSEPVVTLTEGGCPCESSWLEKRRRRDPREDSASAEEALYRLYCVSEWHSQCLQVSGACAEKIECRDAWHADIHSTCSIHTSQIIQTIKS